MYFLYESVLCVFFNSASSKTLALGGAELPGATSPRF